MSFGKTIKNLRRTHDMTQERLAEILSISPQAISRWETNIAMPDISLIAPLCNLFNITSDELLGINLTHRQETISAICDEADKYSSRGYLEKAREILEDGLRKYPDNSDIIYNLMYVSFRQKNVTGNHKYLEEAIKWGEKILEQSTVDYQRHGAIQVLCFSYRDVGRLDEAVKMAESMPFMCVSQEMLLSCVYFGDKRYAAKQREAESLLQFLSNSLSCMQTKLDSGEMAYTPEEEAAIRDKRIAFLHLFFENGDFGFYHSHLADAHREQAFYYASKNDYEKVLKHLSLATDHTIKLITSVNEDCTSLIFRGMDHGSWSTDSPENEATKLLKKIESKIFDKIREKEEFSKIKERLSKYAENWQIE